MHTLAATDYQPHDYTRAVLNILEDAAEERARLQQSQRAVLNVLEDAASERALLKDTQSAVLNILDDSGDEKGRLEEVQKAVMNILEDLGGEMSERSRLEKRFRGLLETAPDSIAIADEAGRIVLVNAQTERMFGFSRDELIGKPIVLLLPALLEGAQGGQGAAAYPPMGTSLEIRALRKDGGAFPSEVLLSPMESEEGLLVSAAVRDISRAKEIELQIRNSLRDKEALLQEIHHRVKNNLQIIASMLSLQSGYIEDPMMLEQFKESQGRIRSMALIHEKLYQSESLARVDLSDYVRGLCEILMRTYTSNPAVRLELDLDAVMVSIDTAVPVGLQLNELITNSFKYAFPAGRAGTLKVLLKDAGEGQYRLRVADDGVGFASDFDFERATSLGLRLVRMFARQLRGTVTFGSQPGATSFEMNFTEGGAR